jgi:SGNH domain (fused to AT3 domains)
VATAAPALADAARRVWPPAPKVHRDPLDAHAGPLDLASAALDQQETEFQLLITAHRPWQARPLSIAGPGSLCLVLSYRPAARPRAELCVAEYHGRPIFRRANLDPTGKRVGPGTVVRAHLFRNDDRTVRAAFSPLDVGLPLGPFAWHLDARWVGGPDCPTTSPCSDRLPQAGEIPGRAVLLAVPRCFGAAARDPAHPCANPRLRTTVTPTPSEALITPNAPCSPLSRIGSVAPCAFGAAPAQARSTLALIGDSHAQHLRGALEVVAQALRLRGLSITRSGCPFNRRPATLLSQALTLGCERWNSETRRWLARHPEVRTIVTSARTGAKFSGDAVAGYRATWHGLPRSVRHIIVIRDTPHVVRPQAACINRLLRANKSIGFRCAQPRALDLPADPEAEAARRSGDPRVRLVDLSAEMCSRTVCPAVIGGVLVRKDGSHLTRLFSTTLGPFVLRSIRHVL